jgi:hypothetical protein
MLKWCKSRSQVNLVIDGVMFVLIMAITGLGFLIKKVLLPGRVAHGLYGDRTELFFFGLNRHSWGTIHLLIGLIFILLLAIHIILHWKLIGCIFRQMFKKSSGRWSIGLLAGIVPLLFLVAPFLITPEIRPLTPNYIHRKSLDQDPNNTDAPTKEKDTLNPSARPVIPKNIKQRRGRMSRT